jgi:hypothetical protein
VEREFSQTYANDKLPPRINGNWASLGNKKIWITEWNIDGKLFPLRQTPWPNPCSMRTCAFSMANEPKVTVSTYHNLLSYDDGYKRGEARMGSA